MARINLLPWREELRKQRKQQFITAVVISLAVAAGVMFWVHMFMESQIEYQQARNNYLREQVRVVEARIKEIEALEKEKASLLARIRVIESLQSNRPEIVHLFEELAKAIPEGLYLTKMKQTGNSIALEGKAQSNARISSFMRNLEATGWFANPVLGQIETVANDQRTFNLTVTQIAKKEGS